MSWEIINQILGLAALDKDFARELLKNPLKAIHERGYSLTSEEEEVFSEISTSDLYTLNKCLRQKMKGIIPDSDK